MIRNLKNLKNGYELPFGNAVSTWSPEARFRLLPFPNKSLIGICVIDNCSPSHKFEFYLYSFPDKEFVRVLKFDNESWLGSGISSRNTPCRSQLVSSDSKYIILHTCSDKIYILDIETGTARFVDDGFAAVFTEDNKVLCVRQNGVSIHRIEESGDLQCEVTYKLPTLIMSGYPNVLYNPLYREVLVISDVIVSLNIGSGESFIFKGTAHDEYEWALHLPKNSFIVVGNRIGSGANCENHILQIIHPLVSDDWALHMRLRRNSIVCSTDSFVGTDFNPKRGVGIMFGYKNVCRRSANTGRYFLDNIACLYFIDVIAKHPRKYVHFIDFEDNFADVILSYDAYRVFLLDYGYKLYDISVDARLPYSLRNMDDSLRPV